MRDVYVSARKPQGADVKHDALSFGGAAPLTALVTVNMEVFFHNIKVEKRNSKERDRERDIYVYMYLSEKKTDTAGIGMILIGR